jgi:ATP synthase protein I
VKDEHGSSPLKPKLSLSQKVGAKAERKLHARRHARRTVWFGLGMLGLIGWSVVIPTLLGTGLGIWLDKRHPGTHSWTLTLLVVGLFVGCLIAWRWVARQYREIGNEEKNNDDKEDKDE